MAPDGRKGETSPPLCANGCGFFGNPATRNLCSKCYNAWLLEKFKAIAITDGVPTEAAPAPPATCGAAVADTIDGGLEQQPAPGRRPARCDRCKKKVGLLGFGCKCGGLFCGVHRHPEQHGCNPDFKKAGREDINRANPLVKAAKLKYV